MDKPKKSLKLVDVSIRDGNQSMWGAVGLNTAQVLQIAPVMARVGYQALDFTSSTAMGMEVKTFHENPWNRIRLARQAMPDTPLQFIGTGLRFISWETQHPEFLQLVYNCLVNAGIDRFVVLDPMNDIDAMLRTAAMYRKAGAPQVMAALVYTISAVHDDAYYATMAARLAASPDIDRFYIKDPSGLLSPVRARSLIPALKAAIGDKPLELHSHCTIAQAPLTYMEAADVGIDVLHVGAGPLGNGSSLPEAGQTLANLTEMGFPVDIDRHALTQVNRYFTELAAAEGRPAGGPQSFDATFLKHQVAGGVMSTTRRQLQELKLEHLFPAVMAEVNQVRAELGYPIMVTPFPQMVCTQALYNVIGSERYDNISDQVILYALGKFGTPASPIDSSVLDRILSLPRARELAQDSELTPLAEMRKRFSATLSDEEFLLRATLPEEQVNAMLANTRVPLRYNSTTKSLLRLIEQPETVIPAAASYNGFSISLSSEITDKTANCVSGEQ